MPTAGVATLCRRRLPLATAVRRTGRAPGAGGAAGLSAPNAARRGRADPVLRAARPPPGLAACRKAASTIAATHGRGGGGRVAPTLRPRRGDRGRLGRARRRAGCRYGGERERGERGKERTRRNSTDTSSPFSAASDPALGAAAAAVLAVGAAVAATARLVTSGMLPATTADVLARVSFVVLLPSLQFSSVGATLAAAATAPDGPGWRLAVLPLAAAAHVALGAGFGAVAGRVADGSLFRRRSAWHAVAAPAASARAAAAALARAAGAPAAAPALLPPPARPPTPPGGRQLVTCACAFGNAVSLPLVLLAALLPPPAFRAAAAYVSLYALGWSPLLWTAGVGMVDNAAAARAQGGGGGGGARAAAAAATSQTSLAAAAAFAATVGKPHVRAAAARFRRAAAAAFTRAASPPLAATAAAVVLSLSPLGPTLFLDAPAGSLPPEAAAAVAAARVAVGAARLLAPAALGVQVLVLGASLAGAAAEAGAPVGNIQPLRVASGGASTRAAAGAAAPRLNLLATAWTSISSWSRRPLTRAVAAVATVRLLLLPAAGVGIVAALRAAGALPADPLVAMVLLMEAASPTSQTLVVIARLRPSRGAVGGDGPAGLSRALARLVVRLYVLSAAPLALAAYLAATAAGVELVGAGGGGGVVGRA